MKKKNQTMEYPATETFDRMFGELTGIAEKVLDVKRRLEKSDPSDDCYYKAMADLYALLVDLQILAPHLEQEMIRMEDLFPEEE